MDYTEQLGVHTQIGICSEIINQASRISNAKLRNHLFKVVGDYRHELRELDELKSVQPHDRGM